MEAILILIAIVILALLLFIYFIPSIVAANREHPSQGGIIVVNIFLGWTFIGWVVSLAWALSGTGQDQAGQTLTQDNQTQTRETPRREDTQMSTTEPSWLRYAAGEHASLLDEHSQTSLAEQRENDDQYQDHPAEKALIRSVDIYQDEMSVFVLNGVRKVYGNDLVDVIMDSLSQDRRANLERDIVRNNGSIEEAMNIWHLRPIIERNWDSCFASRFSNDKTVFRTMARIERYQSQLSHSPNNDNDIDEAVPIFDDIIKMLDHIIATDAALSVEEMKEQLL